MDQSEFVTRANENILIRFCLSENDLECKPHHPTFTHQIFGEDELIVGYNQAKISIYYNASSLSTYINFEYKGKLTTSKSVTPLDQLIKSKIQFEEEHHRVPFEYPVLTTMNDFRKSFKSWSPSFAQQIYSYSVGESKYEVYRSTFENPQMVEYHKRLQTFALFYIQTTSYLDDGDARWNVFLVFEKIKTETNLFQYSIVGYSTVYPFWAYPSNTRLRISQFVILPHHQKRGHGDKLLTTIYEYAKSSKSVELCVEDPSDEFQSLRLKTDLRLYRGLKIDPLREWSKELSTRLRSDTKMTLSQLRICYEVLKLEKILSSNLSDAKKEFEKEIKIRLMKEQDLLEYFPNKQECREKLNELYQNVFEEYIEMIKK